MIEIAVKLLLMIVGIINLLPIIVFFQPDRTNSLYGLSIDGESLMVLMRHRAILLAIVGIALLISSFKPELRAVAIGLALLSKLTFLYLTFSSAGVNAEVRYVAFVDVGAIALLVLVSVLCLVDATDGNKI